MASPQIEDGYIRIANELYDQIMLTRFRVYDRNILDLIIRLSYGCGKTWATIPKQRDFELCGVAEPKIKAALDRMERAHVILRDRESHRFAVNKDFERWRIDLIDGYDPDALQELIRLNVAGRTRAVNFTPGKDLDDDDFTPGKENTLPQVKTNFTPGKDLEPANPLSEPDTGSSKDIKDSKDIAAADARERDPDDPDSFGQLVFAVFGTMDGPTSDELQQCISETSHEVVAAGLREARDDATQNRRTYFRGIMRDWIRAGVTNLDTLDRYHAAHEAQKQQRNKASPPDTYAGRKQEYV